MSNNQTIFIAIGVIALTLLLLFSSGKLFEGYRYFGSIYRPEEGGSMVEPNTECLGHPGDKHCMLSDGTAGKCTLSGLCRASMLIDHRDERKVCAAPVFKEECRHHCRCVGLRDGTLARDEEPSAECVRECKSWFHPY